MVFHESLVVKTSKKLEVLDLTDDINDLLKTTHVNWGLVNLWTVHTTTALTVNENDKGLWIDLIKKFNQFAPVESDYRHLAIFFIENIILVLKICKSFHSRK